MKFSLFMILLCSCASNISSTSRLDYIPQDLVNVKEVNINTYAIIKLMEKNNK